MLQTRNILDYLSDWRHYKIYLASGWLHFSGTWVGHSVCFVDEGVNETGLIFIGAEIVMEECSGLTAFRRGISKHSRQGRAESVLVSCDRSAVCVLLCS